MKKLLMGVAIFIVGFVSAIILTHGSLRAEDSNNSGEVLNKLNELEKSQQNIVALINSVKEDIEIIKIRVTQIQ